MTANEPPGLSDGQPVNQWPERLFDRSQTISCYCGFIDVLGFGATTLASHPTAMDVYEKIFAQGELLLEMTGGGIRLSIISDAFMILSRHLPPIISAAQYLQQLVLQQGYLVRGGIALGPHIESEKYGVGVVVSSALTKAVQIEKRIQWPCVAIDKEVEIPDYAWFMNRVPAPQILYFDGMRIVSPFSEMWCRSSRNWVRSMLSKHPEHAEKYEWFLRLYSAVRRREKLIPPDVLERFNTESTRKIIEDDLRRAGGLPVSAQSQARL